MKYFLTLFTFLILIFSFKVEAQNQRIFVFESGPMLEQIGNISQIRYASRWNDSLFGEIGAIYSNSDIINGSAGNLGISARMSYRLDMLSIIPSLYAGVATGINIDDKSNFMMFEYGISADYMYSRKLYFGLAFGGSLFSFSNSQSSDSNEIQSFSTLLLSFRLTWISGEEW